MANNFTEQKANKAVIFDLDGTLIDSITDITDCMNVMLSKYGYPVLTIEQMKKIVGYGAKNLVKHAIPVELSEAELLERMNFYNDYYTASNSPKTKLFDGIAETLTELKKRGFMLAVLSNKPQETTDNVNDIYLKGLGFAAVCGQSEKVKCKPDPSGVNYILETLKVSPENAYFVGDGDTDVMTAKNAGIKCISVLWGNRTKGELEKVGATVFAENPSDILKVIF